VTGAGLPGCVVLFLFGSRGTLRFQTGTGSVMDVQKANNRRHSKRRSGPFSDLLNVAVFLLALAAVLGVLAVLDPMVKRWFTQFLH
jgi:hypothetical protein